MLVCIQLLYTRFVYVISLVRNIAKISHVGQYDTTATIRRDVATITSAVRYALPKEIDR